MKAVLTFDDGLESHYLQAMPWLQEHGFSATFFITAATGLWTTNTIKELDPDMVEEHIKPDQVAALHEAGFEIGNHTLNHICLPGQPKGIIADDIRGMEKKLAEWGVPKPISFSYPTFRSDVYSSRAIGSLGYKFGRSGFKEPLDKEWHRDPGKREWINYYCPGESDPLRVYITGVLVPNYTANFFEKDLNDAPEGTFPIFALHGLGHKKSHWHSIRRVIEYMAKHGHEFIAMRDLPLK